MSTMRTAARRARIELRRVGRAARSRIAAERDVRRTASSGADLAVFHQLELSPAGGGHQFVRALARELESRGVGLEWNRLSATTPACLYNSFNFDETRFRRFARRPARLVHRVDGPVSAYRGFDDGTDERVAKLNEYAAATIVQSRYSLEKHRELGLELRSPVVIVNAPDPSLFYPPDSREELDGRPLRLVAVSWSANERKGADTLECLARDLDPARFQVSIVGNIRVPGRARRLEPLASGALGAFLRSQDAYVAASREDPCSNALLEALACGLPALYLRSGGHPELVGDAGVGYDVSEELGDAVERLAAGLERYRAAIRVPSLGEVANRYLEVLRMTP